MAEPTQAILTICVLLVCVASADRAAAQGDDGEAGEMGMTESGDLDNLRAHFGEEHFLPEGGFILSQGQRLPAMVWERPALVSQVLDDPTIPTRWFDSDMREATVADEPGRYFAYGEAPAPTGPPLRRAMTCYCLPDGTDLQGLAAATGGEIDHWRHSEHGLIELAALIEGDPVNPRARDAQWRMEDANRQVRLKRKLMGLDDTPLAAVAARRVPGDPSPVLRSGSPAQAGVSLRRVKELEEALDDWYAEARQPTAVVVSRDGVVVLAKSYGEIDGTPATIHTPMLLHSAMKPLMGIQLAMYADRGFVALDQPIGVHLPEFAGPEDRQLTFRAGHVHVSGIRFPWSLAFSRHFYFHTWHEALIAHCPRDWAPGTRYQYGVVGIILAVRALELLSGENYWSAMGRELFAPLGIEDALPGGTGFSAENLARIGVMLHNRGRYGHWELFSENTYQSILPCPLENYFPGLDLTYGVGFQDKGPRFGEGSYGHGGGCGTQLLVNPEKKLVFAMVRNEPGEGYGEHLGRTLKCVLSLDRRGN